MKKETFIAECMDQDIVWNDLVKAGIWYPRTFLGFTVGYGVKFFTGALGYGHYGCPEEDDPYGDYVRLCAIIDEDSSDSTSRTDFLCFEYDQIASIELYKH